MNSLSRDQVLEKIRQLPVNDDWLGNRTLKVTTLDEDNKPISHASAFIMKYDDGLYLYTCWHVVSGIDFFEPKLPHGLRRPWYLRVSGVDVNFQYALNNDRHAVEISGMSIGSQLDVNVSLYDDNERPIWEQAAGDHREHGILNDCGIYVPQGLDVVRIPISLPKSELEDFWAIEPSRCGANLELFADVIVSGYPYGFSTSSHSIMPVFLKRSVASRRTYIYDTYLDGGCSPCMSGGPVWSPDFKLAGIYRGIRYPDSDAAAKSKRKNDRHAALGLMTDYLHFCEFSSQPPGPRLVRW